MNKFLDILKAIGGIVLQVAPSAVTLIGGPALGSLVQTVITAVLTAERSGVPGPDKKQNAMQYLAVASPAIISMIESETGSKLSDPQQFQAGLSGMIDSAVSLMNAFKLLPSGSPAAAK